MGAVKILDGTHLQSGFNSLSGKRISERLPLDHV